MVEDVIDDNELVKSKSNFSFLQHVVLWILWFSVIAGWENLFLLNTRYLIGFGFLFLSTVLIFIRPKLEVYSTLLMLGLGVFNLLHHMGMTVTLTLGGYNNSMTLDLFYIVLLFVYLGMNRAVFAGYFAHKKTKSTEPKKKNIEDNRFLRKYDSKSNNDLESIIKSNKFSNEAVEAANELLKRRGVKSL